MTAPVYATVEELQESLGESGVAPSTYPVRLRQASRLVTRNMTATYKTDTDDYPTDEDQREAAREATLAQAGAWLTNGINPTAGPTQVKRGVKSKSLSGPGGTASTTYDDDQAAEWLNILAGGEELIPSALQILVDANLTTNRVTAAGKGRDTFLVGTAYDLTTGELQP